jgi:hypothetical protein
MEQKVIVLLVLASLMCLCYCVPLADSEVYDGGEWIAGRINDTIGLLMNVSRGVRSFCCIHNCFCACSM